MQVPQAGTAQGDGAGVKGSPLFPILSPDVGGRKCGEGALWPTTHPTFQLFLTWTAVACKSQPLDSASVMAQSQRPSGAAGCISLSEQDCVAKQWNYSLLRATLTQARHSAPWVSS